MLGGGTDDVQLSPCVQRRVESMALNEQVEQLLYNVLKLGKGGIDATVLQLRYQEAYGRRLKQDLKPHSKLKNALRSIPGVGVKLDRYGNELYFLDEEELRRRVAMEQRESKDVDSTSASSNPAVSARSGTKDAPPVVDKSVAVRAKTGALSMEEKIRRLSGFRTRALLREGCVRTTFGHVFASRPPGNAEEKQTASSPARGLRERTQNLGDRILANSSVASPAPASVVVAVPFDNHAPYAKIALEQGDPMLASLPEEPMLPVSPYSSSPGTVAAGPSGVVLEPLYGNLPELGSVPPLPTSPGATMSPVRAPVKSRARLHKERGRQKLTTMLLEDDDGESLRPRPTPRFTPSDDSATVLEIRQRRAREKNLRLMGGE